MEHEKRHPNRSGIARDGEIVRVPINMADSAAHSSPSQIGFMNGSIVEFFDDGTVRTPSIMPDDYTLGLEDGAHFNMRSRAVAAARLTERSMADLDTTASEELAHATMIERQRVAWCQE